MGAGAIEKKLIKKSESKVQQEKAENNYDQ
jgi:hypothetical protein